MLYLELSHAPKLSLFSYLREATHKSNKRKKSQAQLDKEETGKTWSPIKEQGQAEKQPSENQCKWDFLLSFIDVKLYHGTLPKVL